MHSILPQKWACLVLLTGLSATLAKPMPQDLWSGDSLSFPSDGSVSFLPLDGPYDTALAPTESIFTDFPPIDGSSNGLLLGTTPLDSGFQLAEYSTNCLEEYSAVGSAERPSCGSPTPYAGCGVSDGVIDFNSRYKKICDKTNQYCCGTQGGVSAAGALILGNCDHLVYTSTLESIWNAITTFGIPGSAGAGAANGAVNGAGGVGFGLGNKIKKRDGESCAVNYG